MLTEKEKLIVEIYDSRVRGRDTPPPETKIWADDFSYELFSCMQEPRYVVDVGCGYGRCLDTILELGALKYLGIDPSQEQIRLARLLNPGVPFEVGDIYELGAKYPNTFDGYYMAAVLMCLPRDRVKEALLSVRASLKQGAVGLLSAPKGAGEYEWQSNSFTLFEYQELHDLCDSVGLPVWEAHLDKQMIVLGTHAR